MMKERRKSRRIPVHLTLSICDLYKQDAARGIHQLDAPIDVTDISEHGLGFSSECILPIDYYFNASITINGGNTFTSPLHIIRCDVIDRDYYSYGGEFPPLDVKALEIIRQYASRNP